MYRKEVICGAAIYHANLLRTAATRIGSAMVASAYTVTAFASSVIFPHDFASESVAPESPPGSGWSVVNWIT